MPQITFYLPHGYTQSIQETVSWIEEICEDSAEFIKKTHLDRWQYEPTRIELLGANPNNPSSVAIYTVSRKYKELDELLTRDIDDLDDIENILDLLGKIIPANTSAFFFENGIINFQRYQGDFTAASFNWSRKIPTSTKREEKQKKFLGGHINHILDHLGSEKEKKGYSTKESYIQALNKILKMHDFE